MKSVGDQHEVKRSGDKFSERIGITFEEPAFQYYYGPTMNAFAAAEQSGRASELRKELDALFERQNTSTKKCETVIPATFLRVTVAVNVEGAGDGTRSIQAEVA